MLGALILGCFSGFYSEQSQLRSLTEPYWDINFVLSPCPPSPLSRASIQHKYASYPNRIGDGASYHKSDEVKAFLTAENLHCEPEQWQVTCILFAPNAPQQNPVEDIWLQGKTLVRKYWNLCKSFSVIKWLFKLFTNHQRFDFPKLHQYVPCF